MKTIRPQPRSFMRGQIVPAQAHAAEHVDLEEAKPIGIRNLLEGFGLEDAEIVDQDLDVRVFGDDLVHAFAGSQVGREAFDLAFEPALFNF